MNLTFQDAKIQMDGGVWLCIKVNEPALARNFILDKQNRLYDCEIKEHREKRSLDANAYAWVLMQKIAEAIHTDKWSVYLMMLERYSPVFTHIIVRPEAVERVKGEWRTVKVLGPIQVNGSTGIQLQCYFGSSTFDSKEMASFIDGIVSECKEMGIETLPPDEIERMRREWGI